MANAYDYVNLKYVQYNKNTGTVTDVLAAPPPSLFPASATVWPAWKTGSEKNKLADFFPTRTIRAKIESTFGFLPDQDLNETEWLAKMNASAFTLDLKLLFLKSIAELFNPNLVWGFGIYDLSSAVLDSLAGTKTSHDNNEIIYNGLYKIVVNSNDLSYFPNPQFQNMPALRYIEANNNQIKAIGDFATYETGDLEATTSSLANKKESYFLYLQSLWTREKYQEDPAVKAIKKWLDDEIITKNIGSTATRRNTIDNQKKFHFAISANNVYLANKAGTFITSSNKPGNMSASSIPDSDGSFGALNFAEVALNVSKNIYQIDFSHNQLERFLVSPVRFSFVNFSNNKLKYVPPIALQPLPWNYLASGTEKNGLNPTITLDKWNASYSNNNSAPTTKVIGENTGLITRNLLAPSLQFNNNEILDWWPNNPKSDPKANDGWYTWPNTTTSSATNEPPVASSMASVQAQALDPYNRKVDVNFLTTTGNYHAYLHRNFLTKGSYGGVYNSGKNDYNGSAANLLGDWIASGYTSGATADFYRYYFANKDDNVDLLAEQNFTTSLNFNLFNNDPSKQQNFVLPGYITTGKKNTSIETFNSGKTNGSGATNQTSDQYYDNLVPYILGRTLPQNRTTAETWNAKKIKVELFNSSGNNLLSSFASLNAKTVFDALNGGSFSPTSANEIKFLKQLIGALPNGNGTYEAVVTGSTNVAEGVDKNLFKNQSQLTLKISEPKLNLNYTYNINILNNLDYSVSGKHLFTDGVDKDSPKVVNIATSSFYKKAGYATRIQISENDLFNQLETWLNTSDYVKLYLANNPNAFSVVSYDIEKGEIQVQFNTKDVNGLPITLTNLDNNRLTLKGFTPLSYSFIDDKKMVIAVDDETKLDALTNHFLPKTAAEMKTWITNHFQVNWLGLELKDGSKTNGVTAEHTKGYYQLSELKDSETYITNLRLEANNGVTNFTITIPATKDNDNVGLFFSKSFSSFWKFGMSIDTTSYNQADKQTVADFKATPDKLKQFVKLTPTRTLSNGTVHTETPINWNEDSSSKYIPSSHTLGLKITEDNTSQAKGVLGFEVNLSDDENNVVSSQKGELTDLYNYTSQFGLKRGASIGTTGVRYIEDETKASTSVKDLVATLKTYADNTESFRTWIAPLIDFAKSDQTYTANTWNASELPTEKQNQLVYGFGDQASLNAADLNDNVSFDELSNTLTINNLVVKGGYKAGTFYPGSSADAPVNPLPNSTYSFFKQTTQVASLNDFKLASTLVSENNWEKKVYQGQNAYFKAAMEKWQGMLPSQWVAQLLGLKNNNKSSSVNTETYKVNDYASLYSFLNHVLNTSTSNPLFQTRIDISNVSEIEFSDFTGVIKIPAKTLLIFNNYSDEEVSSPDQLSSQPKPYDQEIKFQLSDYKSQLSEEVQKSLPWKPQTAVNAAFQAISTEAVSKSLEGLVADAKKLYLGTASSDEEKTAALTAIQILGNYFLADEYFKQRDASAYFSQKFGSTVADDKKNSFTEFSSISSEDVDSVNGKMKVKVVLKNYISSFDFTTNKYELTDKTETFTLTNLSRLFGMPVWNNDAKTTPNQTVKSEILNLVNLAPELNLVHSQTKKPIFSYETVSRPDFMNETAESYYANLMTNQANQTGEYIKIGPNGLKLANWGVVNNYGTIQSKLEASQYQTLIAKLSHAEIVVKKSDIHLSKTRNQIYFLNALIHFKGTYTNLTQKQAAMANIYDPAQNVPGHIPFDDNNNLLAESLSNIMLSGFKKIPTHVQAKTNVDEIVLGNNKFRKNQVSPSQIYEWIQNNYSNSTALYNLFQSFYDVIGTSDFANPLTVVLNPATMQILEETTSSRNISDWAGFNDGLGVLNFQNLFFMKNSFTTPHQENPTITAAPINNFMDVGSSNNYSLTELKKSTIQAVEVNQQVKNEISQNINVAVNQLVKNNYEMVYRLLFVNAIKTNLVTEQAQLKITEISSDLESGQLLVHYTIHNNYLNGKRTNLSGVYVLNNLYNPLDVFIKQGLAPLLIGVLLIVLAAIYANYKYHKRQNTKKFTLKKIDRQKS